ncbi:MAG TPA: hypothetical protein VNZ58_12340 [Thermomicrobiales bacterium]|nr:hypothetical protein [Thermomicrobiales bacterium]
MADDEIRLPLLKRLAEQAMSDAAFRAVAARDLDQALREYGYDLNESERALVGRFRAALAEAGVDLFLKDEIDLDALFAIDDASEIKQLLDETGH